MTSFYWITGCFLGLIWLSRLVGAGFGMLRIPDISHTEWDLNPASPVPRVSIIVPARNEEENIAKTLTQLLALDYPNYEIIAVDDRSTDRTGEIMDSVAADNNASRLLKVIHVEALPAGWLGKAHAMWTGCCLPTRTYFSSRNPCDARLPTPMQNGPII
jgi:cellulose synthase/poly-beta-1,6-N-acetylglucosamine synthase-like glycosyltransferase